MLIKEKIINSLNQSNNKSNHYFDFFKLSKNKKSNKTKNKSIKNFLTYFFLLQGIFFVHDYYYVYNYLLEQADVGQHTFDMYSDLVKAEKQGERYKTIELFSKIKNLNTPIADLLIGGNLLLVTTQEDVTKQSYYKNASEKDKQFFLEESYKIDADTLNIMSAIYKSDYKSGVESESKKYSVSSCFVLDLVCYATMPVIHYKMQQYNDVISEKIEVAHYNNTHLEEYKKWQEKVKKKLENSDKQNVDLGSDKFNPGQKYYHYADK